MELYDRPMATIDQMPLPSDKRSHIRVSYALYSFAVPTDDGLMSRMLTCPLSALLKGLEKECGDLGKPMPQPLRSALKHAYYALDNLADEIVAQDLDIGDMTANLTGVYLGAVREGLFELLPEEDVSDNKQDCTLTEMDRPPDGAEARQERENQNG